MQITTDAIVIREKKFKGDRILLLLSKDYGVLSAYARGASSPKSKYAAATELFSYSNFVLTQKGENFWVDSADTNKIFFGLRNDINKISTASYFCELTSYLAPKNEEAYEYLRLILNCLHFLSEDKRNSAFLKSLFELRLLTMAGFMPNLVACDNCGEYQTQKMFFSPEKGILICSKCSDSYDDLNGFTKIDISVLSAMRHIIYSDFEKLFSFSLSDNSLKNLNNLSQAYTLSHIDFVPKTLTFLQQTELITQ